MWPARVWREKAWRYRNEASRCRRCGARHFPPRSMCDSCGGGDMETVQMATTGKVLTFTVIRSAPPDLADQVPYVVAVLEMDDGTRTMAQVVDVDPGAVRTGMLVRLEFRRIRQDRASGVIAYGHKAVPV